jgi:hypothetical protein
MPLDSIPAYHARDELRRLNEEIAAVTADRDEAQQAADRLEKPTRLLAEAQQAYAAEKTLYDVVVVIWYENGACSGPRPQPSPMMLELERQIRTLRQDIGASESHLQTARDALDGANARLGQLGLQHRSATYRAVAEAVADHLHTRATPAMVASLMELSVAESLAAELRRIGANEPEASSAAREIERRIFETRSSVAVRGNMTAAAEFIAAIAGDPLAELPALHDAEVLDYRTAGDTADGGWLEAYQPRP